MNYKFFYPALVILFGCGGVALLCGIALMGFDSVELVAGDEPRRNNLAIINDC